MRSNVIIIDGHNLLHKLQDYKQQYNKNPEAAVNSLFEKIRSAVSAKEKLIVVFDGYIDIKKSGIIFSGKQTADNVIRSYIEENYNKTSITVVSSDNEIKRLAKVCGCTLLNSEDFFQKEKKQNIETDPEEKNEKPTGMSGKDYDFFIKSFKK